jgi:hypothetical protein
MGIFGGIQAGLIPEHWWVRFILPRQSGLSHFCGFAPPGGSASFARHLQVARRR